MLENKWTKELVENELKRKNIFITKTHPYVSSGSD
jgi:hypothetical protein